MLYKLNVPLAIYGERVEKGSEVELTDEQVAHLDPADLTLVSSIEAPEPEEVLAEVPLADMSHAQLKARAEELGLSKAGSKADLEERITLHLAGNTEGGEPEEETEGEETTEGGEPEEEITNA